MFDTEFTDVSYTQDRRNDALQPSPGVPLANPSRGRATSGKTAEGERADVPDTLDQYVRSLRSPRVLTREETYDLARQMEAAKADFLAEFYALPATTAKLVELWHLRRSRGHVTAALSARYRDGSGKDWSPQVDRNLKKLERLLDERGGAAAAAAPEVDGRIVRCLAGADLAFEVVL
ncbi:MAG: hypothetical protein QNK04_03715, partial [Myxococcota bacterium]|nr:hypothetical protein [Myxococcota bacterium]